MEWAKLVPELEVSDLERSLDFYVNVLGFRLEFAREEDRFAYLSLGGAQLMLSGLSETPAWSTGSWRTGELAYPFGRGINLQIEVEDAAEMAARLAALAYPLKVPLQDNWYRQGERLNGNREFLVMDPDGYLLRFAQDLGSRALDT